MSTFRRKLSESNAAFCEVFGTRKRKNISNKTTIPIGTLLGLISINTTAVTDKESLTSKSTNAR